MVRVRRVSTMSKCESEFEFVLSMGDKLGDYVHQWIAVVDDELVANGQNAKEVYNKAKEQYPNKTPFIMKVPADEVMLL
jgi:hypothetical protein